jgi:hypothetical protein
MDESGNVLYEVRRISRTYDTTHDVDILLLGTGLGVEMVYIVHTNQTIFTTLLLLALARVARFS